MKKKYRLVFNFVLIIIWLIVIFSLSAMDANESDSKSKGTINKALTKAAEISNDLGITNVNTESTKKIPIITKLNGPLRKCMHATVYFVLTILVYNFFRGLEFGKFKSMILSVFCAFLYACTDEFHQTFVSR